MSLQNIRALGYPHPVAQAAFNELSAAILAAHAAQNTVTAAHDRLLAALAMRPGYDPDQLGAGVVLSEPDLSAASLSPDPESPGASGNARSVVGHDAGLHRGRLQVAFPAADAEANYYARGTRTHTNGKRYFTVTIAGTQPAENGNQEVSAGFVRANWKLPDGFSTGEDAQIVGDDGIFNNSDDLGFLVQAGETFGVWVNFDTGKFWIGNTAEELAGDPETGTGETGSFTPGARMAPLVQLYATDPPNPVSATLGTTTDSGTYLGWDN